MLQKTPNRISGIIHKIQKTSSNYLTVLTHSSSSQESQKGHPLHVYYLNHNTCVTNPSTAVILLEMSSYPQEEPMRINRERFVQHLVQVYKMEESFVRSRITWGIDNFYIYSDENKKFLWPHERIDCERVYLELIAQYAGKT